MGGDAMSDHVLAFDSTWGGQSVASEELSPPVKVGSGIGVSSPPAVMIPDEPTPFVKVIRPASDQHPEVRREEQTAPTLNSFDNAGESRATVLAFSQNQRGELVETEYAHQLTTGGGKPGEGYPAIHIPALTASNDPSRSPQSSEVTQQVAAMVAATAQVRRLTPTECERLMGWPDGHTATRADGSSVADSTRYRMCGNGVVSNVAEWIAGHIAAVLEGQ